MGVDQPYMYDSDRRGSGLPTKEFDPKAVTRASWEPQPKKKKHEGPLVSFNKHPDLHEVPTGRTSFFRPMSNATKSGIVWLRRVQLILRCFALVAALGSLALMILISNVDALTAWVMRIASGVVAINSAYGIWHHIRPAGSRTPASSAAYQLFAAFTDLATLPFYAYGALAVRNRSQTWTTLLSDQTLTNYFVPAYYYTLIGAGGLHLICLGISLWLGLMFRRITKMPPDMNPLEDNLTARAHKRNKSSVSTAYSATSETSKRLSTPLEDRGRSGAPYEDLSRPPSIPFMHTRTGSRDSFMSSKHDLPSRQYGVVPGNSPRNSIASPDDLKRFPMPEDLKRLSKPTSVGRGSYTEIPIHETGSSRPGSATLHSPTSPERQAKFTEAWYTTESLINRTQQKQRAAAAAAAAANKNRAYEALVQRYDGDDTDDDDSDRENNMMRPDAADVSDLDEGILGGSSSRHPNPLRSNPASVVSSSVVSSAPTVPPHGISTNTAYGIPRTKTPYYAPRGGALGEISSNSRSVSGSQDITDQKPAGLPGSGMARNRDSSIQPEEGFFYSKPYGQLKPATPPLIVGSPRQVSSGNDFDFGGSPLASSAKGGYVGYRRNVSGKVAEEGMAGRRTSRYAILNDDY
ncbi:Ergothioneine biosynthesis protein 1 [Pestalotiopsis sp. IQ-011]